MRFFLSLLFLSLPALAQNPSHECGIETGPNLKAQWCIDHIPGSRNPDILYYFHERDGSESSWHNNTWLATDWHQKIRDVWSAQNKDFPTVVSISFGGFWLMSERNGERALVVDQLMPKVEAKLGGLKGRRLLVGRSMGGFNAVQVFTRHPSLFARVALLCPAISTIAAYSSWSEYFQFVRENRELVSQVKLLFMFRMVKSVFPTKELLAQHNPLLLAESLSPQSPKIHVSCGTGDNYGFHLGAEQFAKIARSKGADAEWVPVEGGHCSFDPAAVANFLVQ